MASSMTPCGQLSSPTKHRSPGFRPARLSLSQLPRPSSPACNSPVRPLAASSPAAAAGSPRRSLVACGSTSGGGSSCNSSPRPLPLGPLPPRSPGTCAAAGTGALLSIRCGGGSNSSSSRLICRSSSNSSGSNHHSSGNGGSDTGSHGGSSSSGGGTHEHQQRSVSPVSTAQHYSSNSSSSTSTAAAAAAAAAAHTSNPSPVSATAAAAAAALPSVELPPAAAAAGGEPAAAAAAAAEAALEASESAAAAAVAAAAAMPAAGGGGGPIAGDIQDLFSLLKFQVAGALPAQLQAETLLAIVKVAALDQLPITAVLTPQRLPLLLQLLSSEPGPAVLAAEVLCRVASQELDGHEEMLMTTVTPLLNVVRANAAPEGKRVPLLFFAVSTLVRLCAVKRLAAEIVAGGGVAPLVAALAAAPPAICQVTTFSLFRLMREVDGDMSEEQLSSWGTSSSSSSRSSSGSDSGSELLLLQYVRQGAFSKLCGVLGQVREGSAHELAFSMLLSMALIPAAQALVADRGEVASIVKVMAAAPSPAIRLEAMLVAARLAARCRPVQQDAVREGAVPPLVELMRSGSDEERCHAARLLAILGQHESTHQVIVESGSVEVVLQLLRNRGSLEPPAASWAAAAAAAAAAADTSSNSGDVKAWQAAEAAFNNARAAGLSSAAAANAAAEAVAAFNSGAGSSSSSSQAEVAEEVADAPAEQAQDQEQRQQRADGAAPGAVAAVPAAAAPGGSSGGSPLGPGLVLEQAAGVVCMLCHNPDNHYRLVGDGLVPLLVPLLQKGPSGKTRTYVLASLLMLAMAEPRHAAVVARAGSVPLLVSLVRESSHRPTNRELAAALLAALCRSSAVQVEVVAAGGIPALTRLLAEGTDGARCHAAECLAQLAAGSSVRCRLIVRAGVLPAVRAMLAGTSGSSGGSGSGSACLMWGSRLLKALATERSTLWEMCGTPGLLALLPELLSRRPARQQQQQQQAAAAAPPAAAAEAAAATGSSSEEDEGSVEDEDLQRAHASLAWLVASLASDIRTRTVMIELASFLVRPLVGMLRDAQAGQGSGYSLDDVIDGMANNRQAAAAAALRSMGRASGAAAAMINAELALQLWLGRRVELPQLLEAWGPDSTGAGGGGLGVEDAGWPGLGRAEGEAGEEGEGRAGEGSDDGPEGSSRTEW